MPTTDKGFPYPASSASNNVPADLQAIADMLELWPGIPSLTQTQINALSAGAKTPNLHVFNSTAGQVQRWNGAAWIAVVDVSGISDGDVPVWSAGTSKFEPGAGGGGGGGNAPDDSGTFTASGTFSLGQTLDPAYEYELVIHITATSGTPDLYVRARSAGADVTSGVYDWAGWAKSWGGGFVGWGGSSGTSIPLHYQAATAVTTRMTFIQDTSTRWRATIESTSSATSIACSALGYISAAIDDLNIFPSTGTFTGDWVLYKRSRT